MPGRPDIHKRYDERGRAQGRSGSQNSWPVDMLQPGDVYIHANSGNGFVYDGAVRDLNGLKQIEGLAVAPHMVASYLGAMAAAHVCASVPNFMILEWQIYFHRDAMFKEIVDIDGEMVVDGFIPLAEKPGIGVEINEEAMRRYAPEGVPFFE